MPSIRVGSTLHLAVTVRGTDGGLLPNPTLTYPSSAPLIATVDRAGIVSGVSVGVATITASSGHRSGSLAVQVLPPPAAALGLGYRYTCVLTESGSAYCWGENGVGQLGNGSVAASNLPVQDRPDLRSCSTGVGPSFGCSGAPLPVTGATNSSSSYPAPSMCAGSRPPARCSAGAVMRTASWAT